MKTLGALVTGVGGQGIILASDILCETAIAAGYDVKKTDTLGMAQRGGSVLSHVRIGSRVFSPLICEGEVDILLAFEKLEAARWVNYLHRESTVIVNDYAQPPLSVNLGNEKYPDDEEIKKLIGRRTAGYYFVDGNNEAAKAGDSRALNTFMLGCASCFLPIEIKVWEDMITQRVPARFKETNMKAFEAGRKEMNNVSRR